MDRGNSRSPLHKGLCLLIVGSFVVSSVLYGCDSRGSSEINRPSPDVSRDENVRSGSSTDIERPTGGTLALAVNDRSDDPGLGLIAEATTIRVNSREGSGELPLLVAELSLLDDRRLELSMSFGDLPTLDYEGPRPPDALATFEKIKASIALIWLLDRSPRFTSSGLVATEGPWDIILGADSVLIDDSHRIYVSGYGGASGALKGIVRDYFISELVSRSLSMAFDPSDIDAWWAHVE